MAKEASLCLLFLSFLTICCSGDTVSITSSGTIFLQKNKIIREDKENFPLSGRENLGKFHIRRILDDTNNSPITVFPTNPTSATPPPGTPTIITVPSTNPATTPVTVPSTTPVPLSPTNQVTSPITVPGAQPVTNPVTSYPPPSGNVPVSVINPLPPPANTNAPAIQGQSWCVAKNGASETALQSALDYACGTGTADCSQIQQGGSCYNPNSMQNHASFAFNSFYQKNPVPTSCDFGGTATIVNTNPSSGSCIYPSSSSSSSGLSGATPVAGSESPPAVDTTPTSHSAVLRPFLGCMVLVISLVAGKFSMYP